MKKLIGLFLLVFLFVGVTHATELVRQKNRATYLLFPLVDSEGNYEPGEVGENPDSETVGWNDGKAPVAFADITNEIVELGSTGFYYVLLTQSEMNFNYIAYKVTTDGSIGQSMLIRTTTGDPLSITDTNYEGVKVEMAQEVSTKLQADMATDPTPWKVNMMEVEGLDASTELVAAGTNANATINAYWNVFILVSGTVGAVGNDTTHLHLTGLAYGDDELNDYIIVTYDNSAAEYHSSWITDWDLASELATVATLPFTPEDSVDTYWVFALRKHPDVTTIKTAVEALDNKTEIAQEVSTKIQADMAADPTSWAVNVKEVDGRDAYTELVSASTNGIYSVGTNFYSGAVWRYVQMYGQTPRYILGAVAAKIAGAKKRTINSVDDWDIYYYGLDDPTAAGTAALTFEQVDSNGQTLGTITITAPY
jgi:hypothetical protein